MWLSDRQLGNVMHIWGIYLHEVASQFGKREKLIPGLSSS